MHYKNGREVKVGDVIVHPSFHHAGNAGEAKGSYEKHAAVGRIVSVTPGASSCNANVVPMNTPAISVNLNECLHIEDAPNPLDAPLTGGTAKTEQPNAGA